MMEYTEFDRGDDNELSPPVSGPTVPEERDPANAREVFPIRMERDFKDFRGIPVPVDGIEKDLAPKVSSAQESVATPPSVTGMEDVSSEDLENPAPPSVAKVPSPTSTPPPVSGKPTSSEGTSTGKTKPPAPVQK